MEFNIDIVKGYYEPLSDPRYACFANEHPGLLASELNKLFDTVDHPDEAMFTAQNAFFTTNHRSKVNHDVRVNLNFVEESDIIATQEEIGNTDVGYVYLRASIEDLKKAPYNGMIYLRLIAPQNKVVCLMMSPRMIADVVTSQMGEVTNRCKGFLTPVASTVVRNLISVPHPVDPGMVLAIPYFSNSCLATATYHNTYNIEGFKDAGNIYVQKT